MSQPKVLVLGAGGMLGHKLFEVLRERFPGTRAALLGDVRSPRFSQVSLLQGSDVSSGVDVMDTATLRRFLEDLKPDYIINAVGIIKQRVESASAVPSIAINSLLPHQLAAISASWGGRIIHFSTDCVFDGLRGDYRETDLPNATDLYGRSKALGEVTTGNALTLRTSIIGRELVQHKSLLDWFLSQNHKKLRGYKRVIYSGVTTNQMAEVVTLIIRSFPALSGLYQVVANPISKYDLLVLLRDSYGLDIEITPDDREVSDRSMNGDKLRTTIGYVSPDWDTLVRNLASDSASYESWGIRL
jgi:dTDP-4-dehydrorhamnose reductase